MKQLSVIRKALRESGHLPLVELERELDDSQLLTVIKAFSLSASDEGEQGGTKWIRSPKLRRSV